MRRRKLYRTALLVCAIVYGYLCLRIFGISWFGCLLRTTTGFPCPSCGTTTGIISLIHGDIARAFKCNPLAPILATGFILMQIFMVYDHLFRSNLLVRSYILARRTLHNRFLLIAGAICIILIWIYKIAVR